MKTPPTILELCEKATKGPRETYRGRATGYTEVFVDDTGKGAQSIRPLVSAGFRNLADAQLCARLSPETIKAVYEALTTARFVLEFADEKLKLEGYTGIQVTTRINNAIPDMQQALALLEGTTAPSDLT